MRRDMSPHEAKKETHGSSLSSGKREEERRALSRLAVRPNATAVALDHPRDDRSADAGPRELVGAMQPLEGAEDFLGELLVESDAVVANRETRLSIGRKRARELDARLGPPAREFPRILQQVEEHRSDERAVAPRCERRRANEL